jgi:hypothetical protein
VCGNEFNRLPGFEDLLPRIVHIPYPMTSEFTRRRVPIPVGDCRSPGIPPLTKSPVPAADSSMRLKTRR